MEVQRDNDGDAGAGAGAEAAKNFAIGIAERVADGGAVEGDEEAIDGAHFVDGGEQGGGDPFEIRCGDGAAGNGKRGKAGDGLETGGGAAIEEATKFVVGTGPALLEGGTGGHRGGGEVIPMGGNREKGVGFVEKTENSGPEGGHEIIVQKKL